MPKSPHSEDPDSSEDEEIVAAPKKKFKKTGKRTGKGLYELVKAMTSYRYFGPDDLFDFKYNDVVNVINQVQKVFEKEKMLISCALPAVIVGDVHGQFHDLQRTFQFFNEVEKDGKRPKPGYKTMRYVFMGDYVDRGTKSLEVLMCLFSLKILHPKSFCLLRGNHETRAINRVYGFNQELNERFERDDAKDLFMKFNDLFTHMPIACIVGQSILCMHGGISPLLNSLDDIRNIPKPLGDPNTNKLACDIMWADPMINLKGHRPNEVRGVSIHFGEDLLDEVMKKCNLTMVVRGHQMMMNGFNFFSGHKLVTVFTAASYYPDRPNHGAVMYVSKEGRAGFKILTPMEELVAKRFYGEHDIANQHDDGYQKCTDGGTKKGGNSSRKKGAPPPKKG